MTEKNPSHLLVEAILRRDVHSVENILDTCNLDPDVRNFLGYTPLYQASVMMDNSEIVEVLLSRGANPNFRTSQGTTPLAVALYLGSDDNGFSETIKILKRYGGVV